MIYQNLGQFLKENSQKHKERIAYQIKRGLRTRRFTFGEVYSLAVKTATCLSKEGLKKGDKVAIWAPNMPEYPILYFGCWLMGIIVVPIDVRTTSDTLKVFLEKAKCKIGFVGKFVPGTFGKLVKESFYLEDLTDLCGHLEGANVDHLRGGLALHLKVKPGDLAEIAFTSGTTGTPKGVMLTHGNFLADVEALTSAFPFKKDWRALSILPLSHAFEQVVDFLALFEAGICVTYLERINSLTILRALRKNRISSVVLVPQALRLLMNGIIREVERQGKKKQFEAANKVAPYLPYFLRKLLFREIHKTLGGNLSFFGSGSAPLDLKLAQSWENLGVEIFEGYGATETTAALSINTPSAKRLGSVGKVLPGARVKINRDNGEIEAAGPNISPGYFSAKGGSAAGGEDEVKTKEAFFQEGGGTWYRTGDVGEFDNDGFLYITGREAFRIVLPNGQKVYPEDLEKKLNVHPLVREACVIGVKREDGETVHAAVVTKYPKKLPEIVRDVNQKLASHEQILEWSVWGEEDFPRTPILKIDRKKVSAVVAGLTTLEEGEIVKTATSDKLVSLIAQVAKATPDRIGEKMTLASDLKMDSLNRVELLSLIEEELGMAIDETKVNAQTTVSDLRRLINDGTFGEREVVLNEVIYKPFFSKIRVFLQNLLIFPLFALFAPLEVKGAENLDDLKLPAIFYFNHIGNLDGLSVIRVLPRAIREKLVFAATSEFWEDKRGRFMEILVGGFPFNKNEKVKASLSVTSEFLDKGFSLLLAPEGAVSRDGRLLPFKSGAGLLAVEMQVPVIPVKIDLAYLKVFNRDLSPNWRENLPKKRQAVPITIGKPLLFAKDTSYEAAAGEMRRVMSRL